METIYMTVGMVVVATGVVCAALTVVYGGVRFVSERTKWGRLIPAESIVFALERRGTKGFRFLGVSTQRAMFGLLVEVRKPPQTPKPTYQSDAK